MGGEWACGNLLDSDTCLRCWYGSTLKLYFKDSCWHFYCCSVFGIQFAARMKNYKKAYCSIVPPQQRNPSRSPSLFLLQSCPDFFSQFECFCFYLKLHSPLPCRHPVKFWQKIFISEDDNCPFFFSSSFFLMGREERAYWRLLVWEIVGHAPWLKILLIKVGVVSFSRCLLMEPGVNIVERLSSVYFSPNADVREWRVEPFLLGCLMLAFFSEGAGGVGLSTGFLLLCTLWAFCLMKESSSSNCFCLAGFMACVSSAGGWPCLWKWQSFCIPQSCSADDREWGCP